MKEHKLDINVDLPQEKKITKYIDFLNEVVNVSLYSDNEKKQFKVWSEELKQHFIECNENKIKYDKLKDKYFILVDLSSKQMLSTLEKKQYE